MSQRARFPTESLENSSLVQISVLTESGEPKDLHVSFGEHHNGLEFILHVPAEKIVRRSAGSRTLHIYTPPKPVTLHGHILIVCTAFNWQPHAIAMMEAHAAQMYPPDDDGYDEVRNLVPDASIPDIPNLATLSVGQTIQTGHPVVTAYCSISL
jgi:hypothetical protein